MGRRIDPMRIIAVSALIVWLAVPARAMDEMEMRGQWSRAIGELKQGACAAEDDRGVLKRLGYAAALVMPNEIEEAQRVLDTAAGAARDDACRKAIEDRRLPPGGRP